jgi:hypothetical protein
LILAKAGVGSQAALFWFGPLAAPRKSGKFERRKEQHNMAVIGTSYAWTNPGGGGYQTSTTTAPTAAQAFNLQQLLCLLTAGDADTTCTITHNMNLSAAEQANFYPQIQWWLGQGSTGTLNPILVFTVTTNTITVLKVSAVGSQGSYVVAVSRPSTIIR